MYMMGGGTTCFVSACRIPADSRIFRKTATGLFVIILLSVFSWPVTAAQEAIGINFFDLAHSDAGSPSCWDNNKSYVYLSGSATFTRCSTNFVPVSSNYLVFTTKKPSGSSWNVDFKLDWGHSVNFLRYGESPLLYLRVKWGAIATGADLTITLVDDQSIKTLYRSYNGTGTTYTNQSASVALSTYVTPSTTAWQDVYIPMSAFIASNNNIDLTRIGVLRLAGAGTYSSTNTMYLQKIKVVPSINSQYTDMVKVNQLGYLTNGKKLAIVSYESGAVSSPPTYFQVKDASSGNIVFESHSLVQKTAADDQSGDTVYHADFTAFTTPGRYVIYVPEIGQTSPAFNIGSNVFNEAFRDALRFFYYARSGNEIAEPCAEGHARPTIYASNSACAYDYDDNNSTKMYDYDPNNVGITTRDVRGGWFDAGDLHLDIHNNITPLWFLLEMLEQQKNKLGPNVLNLPESDSQTNDLVLLIKYQLDWFKKMQNTDGSVHFIVYAPSSSDVRYQKISDVSSGAPCVLAGIFAKAYTLFSTMPGMESYSEDLLSRAELSWSWLSAHPNTYDPCSPGIGTDGHWSYGITNDTPYRAFAAIELYLATGESEYRNYFENGFNAATGDKVLNAFGGNSYYGYIGPIDGSALSKGYMDYAEETVRPVTESIRTAIKNSFITAANQLVNRANNGAGTYRVPTLMFNDLYWGSSGLLCGNAYVMLRVYEWTGNANYRNTAIDSLDWISGRNPVSRIFITGDYSDYLHGTDHYSFYMFDHLNPVPGYLCGNINMLADYLLAPYIKHSWKYYLNIQNAAILEPCLHWQAEMCYLLGYFASDLKLPATVDISYLSDFSQAWLSSPGDTNWNPNFDLAVPPDSVVDFADFAILATQWMTPQ
jgi:endoglucanase